MGTVSTAVLSPDELDHAAVVPQCLDVHYVSDTVMKTMLDEGLDYTEPKIRRLRDREAFLEYRRALVFARQTIVNRAYFANPLVYGDFEDRSGNSAARQAFAKLVEGGAIIPYLFKRSDFVADVLALDPPARARAAVESLAGLVDEIRCVRLAMDDRANDRECDRVDQSFRAFVGALGQVKGTLLNSLAAEIYRGTDPSEIDLEKFAAALREVSRFAADAEEFNRTTLYERFLIREGSHNLGRFKSPAENEHMLAQKKLFDLRYNTNLPDMLGRFALTPRGLPTHAAIDMVLPSGPMRQAEVEALLDDLSRKISVKAFSNLQDDFILPALEELSIEDVYEIRRFEEWRQFAAAQEALLADAPNCLEHLERVATSLRGFQRALSRWSFGKTKRQARARQLGSVVSIALQIGGIGLAAFSDAVTPIERFLYAAGPKAIPSRAFEFTARLMIDFVDRKTGMIDAARSFSLDIIRSRVDLTREDIRGLLDQYRLQALDPANAGSPSPS